MRQRSERRHHSLDQPEFGEEEVEDQSLVRHKLLLALKTTVCGILGPGLSNPWATYGGLSRMCKCMKDILDHGLKEVQTPTRMAGRGFWPFVRGLRWLCPTLAPSLETIYRQSRVNPGQETGEIWLEGSLRDLNLSDKLAILVENRHHLEHYYNDDSYLCNKECYSATLICLRALEKNDPALLADVNPSMLNLRPTMVRSYSLPLQGAPPTSAPSTRRSDSRLAPQFSAPPVGAPLRGAGSALAAGSNDRSSPSSDSARQALYSVLSIPPEEHPLSPSLTPESHPLSPSLPSESHPLLHADPLASPPVVAPPIGVRRPRSVSEIVRRPGPNDHQTQITKIPETTRATNSQSQTEISISQSETEITVSQSESDVSINQSGRSVSRSDSKNSALLDLILNQDETITEPEPPPPPPPRPAKTHKRAHSDFALPPSLGGGAPHAPHQGRGPRPKERRPSLMEYGSGCVQPMTECYFPRPRKGQSLRSFLRSHDFHTCAELDKENAHFNISEALIAAIEQMKWSQVLRPGGDEGGSDASDEEIRGLRQRIRMRKRELRQKPRIPFSDGRTTTTSTTSSPGSDRQVWSGSEESDVDVEVEQTNLTDLDQSGLSLSLASLYSDADFPTDSDRADGSTAESVAISLLRQFSDQQLPKASDITWLVSEEDAPQALLPLPDSVPISADDAEESEIADMGGSTRIRGNLEWAPPRAQIIFSIHQPLQLKVQMSRQNFRCAGCGTRVEPGYEKRFRYCEYLGRYFCQCCHDNQTTPLPSRILHKWDFRPRPVSKFSLQLLNRLSDDPLFNVQAVNPGLYGKVKLLESVRQYRVQLFHVQRFLRVCRQATSLYEQIEKQPAHWTADCHVFSLKDLMEVKSGELVTTLRTLVTDAVSHIHSCQLCRGLGFICEVCDVTSDLLFPFDLNRVVQCPDCSCCYHVQCFTAGKCARCARIKARRLQQEFSLPSTPEISEDETDDVTSNDDVMKTLTDRDDAPPVS